jgi:hypothetical protein
MMLEVFHRVDVRQDRHLGQQTGRGCCEDESPRSVIPEGRQFGGGSHVPKADDKE